MIHRIPYTELTRSDKQLYVAGWPGSAGESVFTIVFREMAFEGLKSVWSFEMQIRLIVAQTSKGRQRTVCSSWAGTRAILSFHRYRFIGFRSIFYFAIFSFLSNSIPPLFEPSAAVADDNNCRNKSKAISKVLIIIKFLLNRPPNVCAKFWNSNQGRNLEENKSKRLTTKLFQINLTWTHVGGPKANLRKWKRYKF